MMHWFYIAAVWILASYLFIQILTISGILFFDNDSPTTSPEDIDLPSISILIAARNEEENILQCLQACAALVYPKNKIQILVGNDQSEDCTKEIVESFCSQHPHFKLIDITNNIGNARGKANVLAQLALQATGDIFFITDADIRVNPNWAREMVAYFDKTNVGIVSGVTLVEDSGTMGRMQEIDWMYFMGLLKSFYNLGFHCTAVGNNMAITAKAYKQTGGYEALPFSITEDYKLYKEVRKLKWKTKNVLSVNTINKSAAIKNFTQLMHQRKRWLMGAKELPFFWWILFGVFGLFGPAIICLAVVNLKLALIVYLLKLTLQSLSVYLLEYKMEVKKNFDYLLAYEVYSIFIAISTQVYFMFPSKVNWKNRQY